MENRSAKGEPQQIIVFQQAGSGQSKIAGIQIFGTNIQFAKIFNIDQALPEFIDDPEEYISDDFSGDLVLRILKQPDLIDYLASLCRKKKIPVIAAGKKIAGAITPVTCCGLGRLKGLGAYGEQFGVPEYSVRVRDGVISEIHVLRGASCGASWDVIPRIIGHTPEEALECFAREIQYLCIADPSDFDPITGKSAVHYAGNVHIKAFEKALKQALTEAKG
jgi:hypothetical protein